MAKRMRQMIKQKSGKYNEISIIYVKKCDNDVYDDDEKNTRSEIFLYSKISLRM